MVTMTLKKVDLPPRVDSIQFVETNQINEYLRISRADVRVIGENWLTVIHYMVHDDRFDIEIPLRDIMGEPRDWEFHIKFIMDRAGYEIQGGVVTLHCRHHFSNLEFGNEATITLEGKYDQTMRA